MALLTRRAKARIDAQNAAPREDALRRMIDDPDTGSIKRRLLRRQRDKIVAIGPNAPPAPQLPAAARVSDSSELIAHRGTVEAELAEIDAHAKQVDQRLGRLADRSGSFETQEMAAERHQLLMVRAEFERDLLTWPAADAERRHYVGIRAAELRSQFWSSAERLARAGDHREARRARISALRARLIAEHECGMRQSLSGY